MKILRVEEVGEPDGERALSMTPDMEPSPLVPLPLLPQLSRFFTDAFRRRRIDDLNEPYTMTPLMHVHW